MSQFFSKRLLGIIGLATGPALLLGLALVIGLGTVAPPAQAATTFTVTKTADTNDGTCDADCSLREAIVAANALGGTDTIAFNIPGAGPHTIQPTSALPTITDPVIIDGYIQPGASPNTNGPGLGSNAVLKIELDGSLTGSGANGLDVTSGGSTIRGLVINRFAGFPGSEGNGINISSGGGNNVEGNFIGANTNGNLDLGNTGYGIRIYGSSNNVVGGITTLARNVISGNGLGGLIMTGTDNQVLNNLIGTDASGMADLGNTHSGVVVSSGSGTLIGGAIPAARNIVSGNDQRGIDISGGTGNMVRGNFIGTDVTGTAALGNTHGGIIVVNSSDNVVGGLSDAVSNTIAYNGGSGVEIVKGPPLPLPATPEPDPLGNTTKGNSISFNGGIGIDLWDRSGSGNLNRGISGIAA